MIENLSSYFLPEQQFYLHSVSFEHIERSPSDTAGIQSITLSCNDSLTVNLDTENDTVKLIITRSVSFSPDLFFHASVAYGAILKLSEKKSEIDWSAVDLSKELLQNGQFVTNNLLARITLLLGEITSSSGQTPFILPPQIVTKASRNKK